MTKLRITALWFLLSAHPATPQQTIPPPPKPAASGPSLAETLSYIQDKLEHQGTLYFTVYLHDNQQNTDITLTRAEVISNVRPHPESCSLEYHSVSVFDNKRVTDKDFTVAIKDLRDVSVLTTEDQLKREHAMGAPDLSGKADPETFLLRLNSITAGERVLFFSDHDSADRTAKAFVRAIEICSPPKKELF